MFVDRLQCSKIRSLERKQFRFVDPHAARQPIQTLPSLLAQRHEIENGPQRLRNESCQFAQGHPVYTS